jgi:hypothetical protein
MTAHEDPTAFADLQQDVATQAGAEIVTFTGVLRQVSDPLKFCLSFGGQSTTFDLASVKSCLILGFSIGETIVRIEVDASGVAPSVRALATGGSQVSTNHGDDEKPRKDPIGDTRERDPQTHEFGDDDPFYTSSSSATSFVTPFSLATPRQAPSP